MKKQETEKLKSLGEYDTRVTRYPDGWRCQVTRDGKNVVAATVQARDEIGPAFRDLFRTLDKGGGNQQTAASRRRTGRKGAKQTQVKHIWGNRRPR